MLDQKRGREWIDFLLDYVLNTLIGRDLLIFMGYFDLGHYNSMSFEIRHYNLTIWRSAIITMSLLHSCHFLRLTRIRTHCHTRMATRTRTDPLGVSAVRRQSNDAHSWWIARE